MKKPNLFTHATSELSQDAFFCWLFEWAKDDLANENEALQKASKDFLIGILPEKIHKDYVINEIKPIRQVPVPVKGKKSKNRVDFIVKINNEILLVFEDKTASTTSSSQLKPYRTYIDNNYPQYRGNIFYFYLKSDIVWSDEKNTVAQNGFNLIDIFRIQELLKHSVCNDIYNDYVNIINSRIEKYHSYKSKPINDWETNQWKGFIYDFSDELSTNRSLGEHHSGDVFWYHLSWRDNIRDEKSKLSLEFNSKKLVVKSHIGSDFSKDKKKFREPISKKIAETFNDIKDINGKSFNHSGECVIIYEFEEYFIKNEDNNTINFQASIEKLKKVIDRFNKIEY
jgi:hypothetical protein